jgi:hypothetical protein
MRFNNQNSTRQVRTATKPTESFEFLIERAACCLVLSLIGEIDEAGSKKIHQQAINCMIKAAHSPFFGGTETTVSYEGLTVVREEVFERVEVELVRRGYRI